MPGFCFNGGANRYSSLSFSSRHWGAHTCAISTLFACTCFPGSFPSILLSFFEESQYNAALLLRYTFSYGSYLQSMFKFCLYENDFILHNDFQPGNNPHCLQVTPETKSFDQLTLNSNEYHS